MYFPPWSLWRYGKETSSDRFVRPYFAEVFPSSQFLSSHCKVNFEKSVLFACMDTSIPLKSQSIVSVRFTLSSSEKPYLMLLTSNKLAATTTQIKANVKSFETNSATFYQVGKFNFDS